MHTSTALVGTIASKPQLGLDARGRRRCYVKIRQTVWERGAAGTTRPIDTTYSDMIVTSRAAVWFSSHFQRNDGFIAEGELKTSENNTRYFLAHHIAHNPAQTRYSVTRTPRPTPTQSATPTHHSPSHQPDLTQ